MTTSAQPIPSIPGSAEAAEAPGLGSMTGLRLNLSVPGIDTDAPGFPERLFRMAKESESYQFELSSSGDLTVMAPSGWESNIGESGANGPLTYRTLRTMTGTHAPKRCNSGCPTERYTYRTRPG